jgi:ribosomal protein S27E
MAERQAQPARGAEHHQRAVLHMHRRVERCLICGRTAIEAKSNGRFVTTSCADCAAVLEIEFDPPDQPGIRARIQRLDQPDSE